MHVSFLPKNNPTSGLKILRLAQMHLNNNHDNHHSGFGIDLAPSGPLAQSHALRTQRHTMQLPTGAAIQINIRPCIIAYENDFQWPLPAKHSANTLLPYGAHLQLRPFCISACKKINHKQYHLRPDDPKICTNAYKHKHEHHACDAFAPWGPLCHCPFA